MLYTLHKSDNPSVTLDGTDESGEVAQAEFMLYTPSEKPVAICFSIEITEARAEHYQCEHQRKGTVEVRYRPNRDVTGTEARELRFDWKCGAVLRSGSSAQSGPIYLQGPITKTH